MRPALRQRAYLAALLADAVRRVELARAPKPATGAEILLDLVHGSLLRAAAGTGTSDTPAAAASWSALLEGWTTTHRSWRGMVLIAISLDGYIAAGTETSGG